MTHVIRCKSSVLVRGLTGVPLCGSARQIQVGTMTKVVYSTTFNVLIIIVLHALNQFRIRLYACTIGGLCDMRIYPSVSTYNYLLPEHRNGVRRAWRKLGAGNLNPWLTGESELSQATFSHSEFLCVPLIKIADYQQRGGRKYILFLTVGLLHRFQTLRCIQRQSLPFGKVIQSARVEQANDHLSKPTFDAVNSMQR